MIGTILFIVIVLVAGYGLTIFAEHRNRPHSEALKNIRDRVINYLSSREDCASFDGFMIDVPAGISTDELFDILTQIAEVFGVSANKFRPDDSLGDYFYGTLGEGDQLDERYVEFFDELYELCLKRINKAVLSANNTSVSFLRNEDDALIAMRAMTVKKLCQLVAAAQSLGRQG